MKQKVSLLFLFVFFSSLCYAQENTTNSKTHYDPQKGFTCEELWTMDRIHNNDEYETSTIATTNARTAATDGKYVYVSVSGETATIEKFDALTGKYLGSLPLTLNGLPFSETRAVSQIGFDEYEHLYVASYAPNADGASCLFLYTCNLATGEITSVGDLWFQGGIGRIDYCDVIGDLTGTNADATIMAAASAQDNLNVFAWTRAQGSNEWTGAWPTTLPYQAITSTYPADQAGFSYGSIVKQVRDGSKSGKMGMFIVDGFTTYPALYSKDGTLVCSFEHANTQIKDDMTGEIIQDGVILPAAGTNGVVLANLGGQNFFIYSEGQYDGDHKCQAVVTALDETLSFSSMEHLWLLPEDGLGQTSDTGTRVHSLGCFELPVDENGKHAMLMLTFKCFNGMAMYRIAENGYDPDGSTSTVDKVSNNVFFWKEGNNIKVSQQADLIEVYNLTGQKLHSIRNTSEINVSGQKGLYIICAFINGKYISTKMML